MTMIVTVIQTSIGERLTLNVYNHECIWYTNNISNWINHIAMAALRKRLGLENISI